MKRPLSFVLASLVLVGTVGCGGGGGNKKKTDNPPPSLPQGAVRTPDDTPIVGAKVTFYGATDDTVLSQTTVGANGRFVGNIPGNARRFSVDASAVNINGSSLYDVYLYNGAYYTSSVVGCYPFLPTSGSGTLDEDIVFYPQGAGIVPPPPDGCLAR